METKTDRFDAEYDELTRKIISAEKQRDLHLSHAEEEKRKINAYMEQRAKLKTSGPSEPRVDYSESQEVVFDPDYQVTPPR